MQSAGRLLQMAGLTVPPLAILSQLSGGIRTGQMLGFLLASVCVFWIGRIMEGFAAR